MKSRFASATALAGCLVLLPATALAAPGDLDPAFGQEGRFFSDEIEYGSPMDVGPDGSAFIATAPHSGPQFELVKLEANGELSSAFGGDGSAGVSLEDFDAELAAVDIGPDGRAVLGGYVDVHHDATDAMIARLNADGAADSSFSGDGVVTLDLDQVDTFYDVAVTANGRIVVLGNAYTRDTRTDHWFVARFDSEGDLDPTFGDAGIAYLPNLGKPDFDYPRSLAVNGAGSVYLAIDLDGSQAAVLRLALDGVADPTFSQDGLAVLDLEPGSEVDIELADDGGVAIAGPVILPPQNDHSEGDLFVARIDADGEPVTGFGNSGIETIEIPGVPREADLAPRAAGGWAVTTDEGEVPPDFTLFALTAAGELDPGFSGDGIVRTDVSGVGSRDYAYALGVAPDGDLIVLGGADGWDLDGKGSLPEAAVTRYLDAPGPPDADADGTFDPDDTCPERPGKDRNGCRVFRPSRIHIGYRAAITDFSGHVFFKPATECAHGIVVKLFRKRPGRDRLIGRSAAAPNREGHWEVSALAPPGLYYARTVPRLVPELGYCASGTSKIVRRG